VNELHDLVAPYALDALDAAERAEFEAHLETCPRCLEELAELSEAATDLAADFAVAPPEELKARILDAVEPSISPATVTKLEPRRRVGWMIPAAAAVIAIVFAGLWAFTNAQLDEANLTAAVYEAPDATVVELETADGPARFTYSPTLGRGVFNGSELSELAETDVYQLWLIDQAGPRSAGVLEPGDSSVLVEAVAPGLTLAMTVEPEPGGDAPSTEPLFATDL
jgi:anti-sigma-K factor RskA